MTIRSQAELLSAIPGTLASATNRGPQAVARVPDSLLTDIVDTAMAIQARVGSRVVSGGQGSDGSSQTIAVYQIDLTEVFAVVGGVADHIAALSDQDLLADIDSYQLDGTAAVALTADGQTYEVALVAHVVSGGLRLAAVFGAEAADGAEAEPTGAQCQAALVAAGITGHDATRGGVVVNRVKIQRVAVDTITCTWETITDDGPAEERAAGTLL